DRRREVVQVFAVQPALHKSDRAVRIEQRCLGRTLVVNRQQTDVVVFLERREVFPLQARTDGQIWFQTPAILSVNSPIVQRVVANAWHTGDVTRSLIVGLEGLADRGDDAAQK